MDTFRKWLNKPKADDKSLLARFYHADRALAAVASELDSFDGRSEPDRCSRLVSRLRQSQDKVLFITNLIMDELLGDDRDPRSFRAKFPEEVLQENLGGQLWFGAECLAAGSSIMNREQESKDMRPLAQAVTKSLGNVRNLLRDQCLRNNVPNSRTLHLNLNDSSTEQLCESLKIFDRLFAEFELRYVSAMVQVKTKQEYEMQELICVLFSETLQRALSIGLLEQDKVDSFDPALMFSIPRLAIICGLVIYQRGPLNMDMAADQLSEMFRPFRTILIKIRNLLRSLNKNELHQLERLLCTNEDIHLKVEVGSSSIEAPPSLDQQNNNEGSNSGCTKTNQNSNYDDKRHSFSGDNGGPNKTVKSPLKDNNNPTSSSGNAVHQAASSSSSHKRELQSTSNATHSLKTACTVLGTPTCSPVFSVSAESSATSTPTVSPVASPTPSHSIASISSVVSISTTSPTEWTDDDEDKSSDADEDVDEDEVLPKEQDIVSADCASGYLIPNTNFGNLLQPQEVPLTDNFVASEDEFAGNQTDAEHTSTTLTDLPSTSTVSTHNCTTSTHTYTSEESEQLTIKASSKSERSMVSKSDGSSRSTSSCSCSRRQECHQHQQESSSSNIASDEVVRRHHHHHAHRHHHHRHHHHHHHHRHQHSKSTRSTVVGEREGEMNQDTNGSTTAKGGLKKSHTSKHWVSKHSSIEDISSADSTSASSVSDGDSHEVSMALRAAGRHKFKSIENLLHRLFVCIAGVADQLQTNFASDLRQILRSVFLMNMSSSEEEVLDIPEKTKESELFEFRASENDVIQESAGSNQSIYSAEEVNPELDNVFNNSGSAAVIQRIHTIDLGDNSEATVAANMRNTMGRSRSLGDRNEIETGTSGSSSNSNNNNARNLSSYINGGRLSSPSRQPAMLQRHRNRNNSVGTNSSVSSSSSSSSPSSSSSSESNSPVSERVSTCFPPTNNCSQSSANSVTANNNNSAVEEGPTGGFLTSPSTQSQSLRLAPPAWIPDEKAPRCMSCHTPFTAFRRRHHCRNCGGVFCGVCSNASAPLPKYGLTKAVRMCRECYMREIRSVNSMRNNAPPRAAVSMQHPTAAAIVGS